MKVFGQKKNINVAGVTFSGRQGKLWNLKANSASGVYVTLRREPDNKYDSNAIKVIAHIPAKRSHFEIGYVPKDLAFWLAPHMDANKIIRTSNVRVIGGYGKKATLGCLFNLAYEL